MNERDNIIRAINLVLESSSDTQLNLLKSVVKKTLNSEKFISLGEKIIKNVATSDRSNTLEDVSEGNWGTLYRNNS